jgi:HAD superfamily hydrolase (TIGR01450 family)
MSLQEREIGFLLLTNNSSRHRKQYGEKLRNFGLDVTDTQIYTSSEAAAWHLHREKPGSKVFVVGTPALEEELITWGFTLVQDDPEVVILGFDTGITYKKLWKLCDQVRAGTPYIATHPDFNCPTETGYMPDIGATIAFVQASTGRRPDLIAGKPNRTIMEAIGEKLGLPVESLGMVGDRLYTDIALGQWGVVTVLVLTGETKEGDLLDSRYQPDYVMNDLAELTLFLENQLDSPPSEP